MKTQLVIFKEKISSRIGLFWMGEKLFSSYEEFGIKNEEYKLKLFLLEDCPSQILNNFDITPKNCDEYNNIKAFEIIEKFI